MYEYDPLSLFVVRWPGKVTLLECERCGETQTFSDTVRLSDIRDWVEEHLSRTDKWHGPENMNGES